MKTHKKYGKPPCRFKAALSEEAFQKLARSFNHRGDWTETCYIYFDTSRQQSEAQLYQHELRLRLRVKQGKISLELKDYRDHLHWDVGQKISEEEMRGVLLGDIPDGEIRRTLSVLELKQRLVCIRIAHTSRKKILLDAGGILVLDRTLWPQVRYEIEYRSEQEEIPVTVENIRQHFCPRPRAYDKMEELWTTDEVVA